MILRPTRILLAVSAAALASVALASCSSTAAPTGRASAPSGSVSAPVSAVASTPSPTATATTYTADDLTAIATATKARLGLGGTILDDAGVASTNSSGSTPSEALISDPAVAVTPAACRDVVTSKLSLVPPSGTRTEGLVVGSDTVFFTTVDGSELPDFATTGAHATALAPYLAQCGSMQATNEGFTLDLTLAKAGVTTTADSTASFDETLTAPASAGPYAGSATVTVVEAVEGNLLITGLSLGPSTIKGIDGGTPGTPTLTTVVHTALVAAAAH